MSTTFSVPRRRLSARRGSTSAPDPFGVHADAETAEGKASRITILPVRSPPAQNILGHNNARDRSSWGSTHSTSSNASTGRGRLSFAFTSFTPINGAKGGDGAQGNANGPPSPGGRFPRSSSSHSLDRTAQRGPIHHQHLSPQQVCELAISSISNPPLASPPIEGHPQHYTPFMLLPDEQYLPFLERPTEVTQLLTSAPTNRLMALLQQTFPSDLRASYDPSAPPNPFGEDPAKWSYAELIHWLHTIDRDEAPDREWVSKARKCVLVRSELIWSRLKAALGVPPELEEEEEEYDEEDEEERVADYVYTDEEREAWLEPIYDGDRGKCVASPVITPNNPFDGVMESIGESNEEEDSEKEKEPVSEAARPIHGLRLSTPMAEVDKSRSRSVSPVVPVRRALSSTAAPDDAADARRREAVAASVVPGRVRRSAQQERGTGDPLFPSSFATLTMGPSLVANNPALRSGPRRTFRPGVPITGRRGGRYYSGSLSGGWDTDGNDYAISLGSGSERSFVGR